MQYIPDTYLDDTRVDYDTFLELQFKYRKGVINYLSSIFNFKSIDEEISKYDVDIPIVEDTDYNFYHKNSNIGSNYLYLRNNIHIERLNDEELKKLLNEKITDLSFFKDTFERVLYEDGDMTSYGIYPNDANTKKSKALVFEFAYDQRKLKSVDELLKIRKCYNDVFSFISDKLNENGIESDYLVYECIPELFKKEEKEITK